MTILAIGLITPGPNALTCFAHSGMFEPKANVQLITGMVIGFITIELSVGLLVDAVSDSATAMTDDGGDDVFNVSPPKEVNGRINPNDGYEWLEYPEAAVSTITGRKRATSGPSGKADLALVHPFLG